jgi:hypothetical protein
MIYTGDVVGSSSLFKPEFFSPGEGFTGEMTKKNNSFLDI